MVTASSPLPLFKALADDTRLQLMLLIMTEGEVCVCEMTHALNETQPKISRHLALLRQARLLADRREGQWVYYRLADTLDEGSKILLTQTQQHYRGYIAPALARLDKMGNRPDRRQLCC
ncbi:metalloregulator ArsR/SmtB family transcription factor [Oceanimonas baumannii]|uniref:Transcriptional regulator n=1 Tax=Oceanimonas baumannii TaxID=129578 RepID=A0A235CFH0_9GAMM|nr:metalloregulator ArsR/SmtB family transcription factor [Oceanimonas baumannii]MCC4265818.1 metalloregulator ArsR/SmtB family transcription factor [Oceanimonas baumannii]OYD23371.1 transcriptional regulator [Oceanimonas baumannii]TDW58477.1 ArsR family transcriptional regulator [Oceanimonas baumannii]